MRGETELAICPRWFTGGKWSRKFWPWLHKEKGRWRQSYLGKSEQGARDKSCHCLTIHLPGGGGEAAFSWALFVFHLIKSVALCQMWSSDEEEKSQGWREQRNKLAFSIFYPLVLSSVASHFPSAISLQGGNFSLPWNSWMLVKKTYRKKNTRCHQSKMSRRAASVEHMPLLTSDMSCMATQI